MEEQNSYECATICDPKKVAEIVLCGYVRIDICDNMNFIKPTPEQIKNLHDMLCIDVKLFDEEGKEISYDMEETQEVR